MARETLLTLDCSSYSDNITDIIKVLNDAGWIFRNDIMEYLPLHDDDNYDWQEEQLSCEKLFGIVSEKQKNGELAGVILYHRDSDRGIILLAGSTKEIMIAPDINRKLLIDDVRNNCDFTDISWYIMNICVELQKRGCTLESIMCHDCIG